MPLTRISCPYCEVKVEVQVASVTRSRVCPACGETFVLQLTEGGRKRKALLMERETAEMDWEATKIGLPYSPQALSGEAYERMRLDPELERLRRKFVVGVLVVLCTGGTMVGMYDWEEGGLEAPKKVVMNDTAKPALPPKPSAIAAKAEAKEAAPDFGDLPFEQLFEERPKSPVLLRVWARAGDRYSGLFDDPAWVNCVELRPAGEPEGTVIFAYVDRKSVTGGDVGFRMRQVGSEAQKWTVRVKYPPLADEPDQVWLEAVVADSWLEKQAE